jgi:type IV pilus assembly protein PilE
MPATRIRGFTLIELMITVAILAIIASLAMPSYSAYIQRSRLPSALDALTVTAAKMEMVYQDNNGNYGAGPTCNVAMGTATNFTLSCSVTGGGTGFVARATGSGNVAGYTYKIDHTGARATEAHPKGSNPNCWTTKGGTSCDN